VFKKLSAAAALTTTVFLLSVSLVYACPDMARIHSAPQLNFMHDGMPQEAPCGQQKQEICDFVRDSMQSIQPSPYQAAAFQQSILHLHPVPLSIGISDHTVFPSHSAVWEIAFHSVFKIPLSLSSSVLRI
jgi:hypothetical protein